MCLQETVRTLEGKKQVRAVFCFINCFAQGANKLDMEELVMNTRFSRGLAVAAMISSGLTQIVSPVMADTYNKQRAVNYARNYARSYNYPAFPIFQSDCTNFVSQALLMGGWTFRYNGNSAYAWWYGGRHDAWWSYSDSFVNAHLLFNFIRNTRRGDIIGEGTFRTGQRGPYNALQPGDLIFADWFKNGNVPGQDGWIDHVYIVTGWDSSRGGILVSAHTTPRLDLPFKDVFDDYNINTFAVFGRFYYVRMREQY